MQQLRIWKARGKPRIGISVNRDYEHDRFWLPAAYCSRIESAGALPLLIPPLDPAGAMIMVESLDGLLLSGGGDVAPLYYGQEAQPGLGEVDLQRDAWEFALVRAALPLGLPLLGICRGLQLINIALGGTLIQDLGGAGCLQHRQQAPGSHASHTIEILPQTRLAIHLAGEGCLAVNSFHHQAPAAVAPGLRKAALAPDGVIEALEDSLHPFLLGVQWHPETLQHPASESLFKAFVSAAAGSP